MNKTKLLTLNGIFAAVYIVLTMINPLSYAGLQFRVSTLLLPFATCIPQIRFGLVLGTAIANLNSPLGLIDVIVGSIVSVIAVYGCARVKNRFIRTLSYAIDSGVLVALELWYCFKVPVLYNIITVGISGFIIYFIGTYVAEQASKRVRKFVM